MIYLELVDMGDKYGIGLQHYRPSDLNKTDEELRQSGLIVESLPIQDFTSGKQAVLCAKKDTKELYYEYVDSEATQIEQLRSDNLATMDALAEVYELILGGM